MDDLENFEAFLDEDFNEFEFSNDMLLGTNTHTATNLDIETSIKKLTFDLDEVEKRMTGITSQNYGTLLTNFEKIETTNELLHKRLVPALDRVNNSFSKVKTEVIEPYEEASKMNAALKNVHTTLDLLRGANFFFLLILQIAELESSEDDKRSKNDIVKLAKLFKQVNDLYTKNVDSILSIKLIRDYQSIHLTQHHKLITSCVETIVNEFGHTSRVTSDNHKLQTHLISYYILEPEKFVDLIEKSAFNKHITTISSQLSKSLQSPRNFIVNLQDIKTTINQYLATVTKLLSSCEIPSNTEHTSTLYNIFIHSKGYKSLAEAYWPPLALQFKRSIASTMARGGPIAKNIRVYKNGIKDSVNDAFLSPEEVVQLGLFTEAIDLIK